MAWADMAQFGALGVQGLGFLLTIAAMGYVTWRMLRRQ